MAFDAAEVGAEHITVKAGEDLRLYQHHAVKVTAPGVIRSVGVTTSGHTFVLMNKPNSGEAATLYGAPNVAKSLSGGTIPLGGYVTDDGSAFFVAGSLANAFGVAQEAAVTGDVFALRLL